MSNYIYTVNGEYKKIKKDDVIEMYGPAISTDGRCGPSNGHKRCPDNQCCSSNGVCGGTRRKRNSRSEWCSKYVSGKGNNRWVGGQSSYDGFSYF